MGATVAISLLMTAWTAEGAGRSRTIALVIAGLTCVAWVLAFCHYDATFNSLPFRLATCGVTLLFFAITGSIMLTDVYTGTVTNNRICGAICVYMLLGFCFAMINLMIFLTDSNAYNDSSASDSAHEALSVSLPIQDKFPIFIYFSFCTLTTVGYGDITPVSRLARTAAWLEAVAGQIYLTVLVARLVGLHIAFSNRPKEDAA